MSFQIGTPVYYRAPFQYVQGVVVGYTRRRVCVSTFYGVKKVRPGRLGLRIPTKP